VLQERREVDALGFFCSFRALLSAFAGQVASRSLRERGEFSATVRELD